MGPTGARTVAMAPRQILLPRQPPSMESPAVQQSAGKLLQNLAQVIVGKDEALEQLAVGLLCQGHVLIEDVPGVGKTVLTRSLAQSLHCSFSRLQFTPDLLPSDITGTSIFNPQTREFEFRAGPLMAQIVLADEINRASPKTQSALLEAMEERQITVDGVPHPLPQPFMVVATQNPIEYEGTFPLPEAQLDRFLLRVHLGYLSKEDETAMIERQQLDHPLASLRPVIEPAELLSLQQAVKRVFVSAPVKRYIIDLTFATREMGAVYLGSSPRGSLGLHRASQARAAIHGREFVLPDDVKALAEPVLAHRIILNPAARMKSVTSRQLIADLLDQVPLPDAASR
jgi:MoxR-like ATPase